MKKNEHSAYKNLSTPPKRKWIKLIISMKLTFSLVVLLNLTGFASLYSQSKVSITAQNESVEHILQKIITTTDYYILYNEDDIRKIREGKTIDVKDSNIEYVLDVCLENSNLAYMIKDNTIIIAEQDVITPMSAIGFKTAQQQKSIIIMGKVVDKEGKPIPGVSIKVKDANRGTITNEKGVYSLSIEDTDKILVFTFVGMKKQEVEIANRSTIDLIMEDESTELGQVVVTGMFTRKAQSYTGSVSTITAKELSLNGNRNLVTSLQNIDPSFNVIANNSFGSDPNRLPEIQIRGNSSIPNIDQLKDENRVGMNTPLIILDGFEVPLRRLMDMNENEVESITILKDASATAIYGSRGANGIVVITTKLPKSGKLTITYNSSLNVEVPDLTGYDLLNAREKLDLEKKVGLYNSVSPSTDLILKGYYNSILNEVNSGVNTDWLSKPLRTGVGQRHNIRLEGGDNAFRYSASVQYNKTEGVMKGSDRNTLNSSIMLSYTYNKVKFTNSFMTSVNKSENSPYGSFSSYARLNPYWRAYDENGNVVKLLGNFPGVNTYWPNANGQSTIPVNPLYNASLNTYDKTNTTDVTNNTALEWNLISGLKLRASIGITKTFGQSDIFKPAEHTDFAATTDPLRRGSYQYGTSNSFNYDGKADIVYTKEFAEKHSVFAGINFSIAQYTSSAYSFLAEGFTNQNLDFPTMAAQYELNGKPRGSESKTRSIGVTSNFNYTYDNRYYADLSLRREGSSQFGSKHRFAPFWSIGSGWNVNEESFLKESKIIDRLKIRGSVGVTGSQNFNSYQALSTYSYYSNDRYYTWNGAYLLGLGNDNLKWQQKINYNLGIESQLLKNRISVVADYYISRTNGLISSVNLPLSNGFNSYTENLGEIKNKGYELKVTAYVFRNPEKGFSWSITGIMNHNENKLVKLSQAMLDAQKAIEEAGGSNPNTLYRVGQSTSTIYVVRSLGIDPSSGKEVYLDRNNNPTYTWNSLDLRPCGDTEPKIQGSISSVVRYKSFTANVTFGYKLGGQAYNQTLINKVENADYKYNVDQRVYDNRWQKPGDQAAFKGLLVTTATNMSSRFVEDENTFRCQNITIQYSVKPNTFTKNLNIQSLVLTGNMGDIFYLSTVKRERGLTYPFSRQFSFGLNVIF